MSLINTGSQIPTNILTLEQTAAWAILSLVAVNPNKVYLEDPATSVLVVQSGIIKAGDNSNRLLLRAALDLNSDYITSTAPLWMAAKEISDSQIPAAYLRQ